MLRRLLSVCCLLIALPAFAQEFEQVNTTSPQTLEHKTLVTPSLAAPNISGTVTGTPTIPGATLPNPTITGTVGGGATYAGPTLTSPTVSGTMSGTPAIPGATLANPTITGTVPGSAAYTSPTLNSATLAGTKQFYENIVTQDAYVDIATAAASCIGKVLVITKAVTVTTNLTFGSTCVLHIVPGAGSLVFNANISANVTHLVAESLYPIFSGAGCVVATPCVAFTRGRVVYAEWWGGGVTASAAANTKAGNLAILSLPAGPLGGGVVQWQAGTYDHDATFYTSGRYVTFRGLGMLSTRLRNTVQARLNHTLSCSGTTGYIGVEDIEMSPSSTVTTDHDMKSVNFNIGEAGSGGVGCTPAANSVLHVERFKSTGFNFGPYTDGGTSILITYAECVQCTIRVHGQTASSIADPLIFQNTRMAVVRDSDLSCDSSTCDHALYFIKNINIRVTNNKVSGFVSEAFKFIMQDHPGVPEPAEFLAENNEFRNNGSSGVVTIDGPVSLENLVWRNNASYDNAFGSTSQADVYIEAINLGKIRKCDCSHNYFENLTQQAMQFSTEAGSNIDYVDVTDTHVNVWGTSATGTFSAINYGGNGTMKYAKVGGFFNGGTYGKAIHGLMQGGTGFTKVDAVGIFTENMNPGVPASPSLLQTEMGGSGTFSPFLQRAYCTTTATGTDANTSEKDLATFSLPANLFFTNNAGILIDAWGVTAANGNTKTVKAYFGANVIAQNAVTTAPNNLGWTIRAAVHRVSSGNQTYGANMMVGAIPQAAGVGTVAVTDSLAITTKVTGQNGTGNANEITLQGFSLYFIPPYPIW